MASSDKSGPLEAALTNPKLGHVLSTTNLGTVLVIGLLARDALVDQLGRIEEVQTTMVRMEASLTGLTHTVERLQTEAARTQAELEALRAKGATADEVQRLEKRIDDMIARLRHVERCAIEKKGCSGG